MLRSNFRDKTDERIETKSGWNKSRSVFSGLLTAEDDGAGPGGMRKQTEFRHGSGTVRNTDRTTAGIIITSIR